MKFLASIFLLVTLTSAAPQKREAAPCSSPEQFVGNFGVFSRTHDWKESGHIGHMFYDGPNKRVRVDTTVNGVQYKVIQLYNEHMQFVIQGEECHSMSFKQAFHPVALPEEAKLIEEGRIGTSSSTNGLNIKRYYGVKEGARYLATVTADQCLITSAFAVSKEGTMFFSLTGVSRLETVDADFAHPSNCQAVPDEDGAEGARAMPVFNAF